MNFTPNYIALPKSLIGIHRFIPREEMSHTLHIHAIHSNTTKVLDKVFEQWDSFRKTMEAFSHEDESAYLKSFLIDNNLLEPYNGTLPLLNVPSYDVLVLKAIDHPSHIVVFQIIERLCQLGSARTFLYTYRESQEPVSVLVWESDYNKLTKHMKNKLVRIRI